MAQLYDSTKVRTAAQSVRVLRDNLEQGAMEPGRRAIRESEPLKGAAADAMRERLSQLTREVSKLGGELSGISTALNRYALVLEEVGDKLTRQML